MAKTLLFLIIAFVTLDFVISSVLSWLNTKWMTHPVPPELEGLYDEEKYRKQQDYMRTNKRVSLVERCVSFALTLVILGFGLLGWLDNQCKAWTDVPVLQVILFLVIYNLFNTVIALPFSYYSTFVIEERFGFNRTTHKTFWLDAVKSFAVSTVLSAVLLGVDVTLGAKRLQGCIVEAGQAQAGYESAISEGSAAIVLERAPAFPRPATPSAWRAAQTGTHCALHWRAAPVAIARMAAAARCGHAPENVQLALHYQVLTPKTAFLLVHERAEDEKPPSCAALETRKVSAPAPTARRTAYEPHGSAKGIYRGRFAKTDRKRGVPQGWRRDRRNPRSLQGY